MKHVQAEETYDLSKRLLEKEHPTKHPRVLGYSICGFIQRLLAPFNLVDIRDAVCLPELSTNIDYAFYMRGMGPAL